MTMLGKRYAEDMEARLTEYYRQECLRSLYQKQERISVEDPMTTHEPRKGVSFAMTPEIIGWADPLVDRRPIDVSPITKMEFLVLLSQRTFP